jgi:UDP-GlcNAc3NAcA epimerase
MRKIVTIVGARPQFIKVAPVSRKLRRVAQEILVDTGQHYDHNMAGVFFQELDIPKPDYDLGIGSGTHGQQTGAMLAGVEEVLLKEKPDGVLVYGDTNSTLAGALAAAKLHLPVFHVEAGLRSFNQRMPEEINRVLTDHISTLLFSPTETAVVNLANEGITQGVHLVGDVMYDAVLYNLKLATEKYRLRDFGLEEQDYFLATIHRAENTDDEKQLKAIFKALASLDALVYLPLHPRTRKRLEETGLSSIAQEAGNIWLRPPVSYLEMLFLEANAQGIITDSGGVQKEAYFVKVPCYTVREQTEWVETIEVGWNRLFNPLTMDLKSLVQRKRETPYEEGLYGDGRASEKIVECILSYFKERDEHDGKN